MRETPRNKAEAAAAAVAAAARLATETAAEVAKEAAAKATPRSATDVQSSAGPSDAAAEAPRSRGSKGAERHHNHNNDGHGAGSSDTIDGDSGGNIYPGNRSRTPPSYSAILNKSTTRWGRGGPHLSLRWIRGLSVCIARLVKKMEYMMQQQRHSWWQQLLRLRRRLW